MAKALTAITVEKLRPKAGRYEIADGGQRGLYVVVFPSGVKSYVCRYRFPVGGKKYKLTFKKMSLADARLATAKAMRQLHEGVNPQTEHRTETVKAANANTNTVHAVLERYLSTGDAKQLRTVEMQRQTFKRLVYPAIGDTPVANLRRSDIVKLLDHIENKSGPVQADRTLAYIRKALRWYAVRDEDFIVPIVPGMQRTKPKDLARSRILSDAELARVWVTANEQEHPFALLVRFLLLTAARRNEAALMTWAEIEGADWTLPAARNKTKQPLVRPLSQAARTLLDGVPRIEGCPYVFTTDGRRPLTGLGFAKRKFDAACGVTDWTLHDLRRTARSLMSRAGVNGDHAEQCLGHIIGGVRGTYDRHAYHEEKAHAFEALAALIERIVNPPADNVTPMVRKSRR